MQKTTTIKIDDRLHKAAVDLASERFLRGGFSAYVQNLVSEDLKKAGKLPKVKEAK